MSNLEEILGRSIDSTKELKQAILDLRNGIKDLGTDENALQTANAQLNAAQEEYNRITSAGKQATDFAKDSIIGMEKEYKNLYNTYRMLSEEQRNTDFGKNMAASLNVLSEKLNSSKKEVGNFKDNIGHYSQDVMDAFSKMGISVGALQGPMKLAAGGVKTFSNSLKALVANPVGASIMAIVVAFKAMEAIVKQVKTAIDSNEESQMRLKVAMSAFQPIVDNVKNAFDRLAQGVITIVEAYSKIYNKMRELKAAFTDFIGLTDGKREAVQQEIKTYEDLAKAQYNYVKRQREVNKSNAADKATVESLKNQATEATNAEDKLRLLNEAKELQAEIDQRNIELAEENLRILEEESKLAANDAEMNDKLAQAEANVANARAQAEANAKSLNKTIVTLTKSTNNYSDTLKTEKEILEEIEKRLEENSKTEIQKVTEKYEKEKAILIMYHRDTTRLTEEYNKKIAEIENRRVALIKEQRIQSMASLKEYSEAYAEYRGTISKIDLLTNRVNAANSDKLHAESINEEVKKIFKEATKTAKEGTEEYQEAIQKSFDETMVDYAKEQISITSYMIDVLKLNPSEIVNVKEWEAILMKIKTQANVAAKEFQDEYISYMDLIFSHNSELDKAEIDYEKGTFEYLNAIAKEDDALLRNKIELRENELGRFKGTEEERYKFVSELNSLREEETERLYAREAELQDLQIERNWQIYESAMSNVDAIMNVVNSLSTMTKAEIDSGKLSEKQIEKKKKALKTLNEIQKVVGIGSIIADTAAGITSIWQAYAKEKVANAQTAAGTGAGAAAAYSALNAKSLASAILNTASITTTGIAQLAAIKGQYISNKTSIDNMGGGDDSGAAASPVSIDSTPYSYTRTLQTEEEEERLNSPIFVKVTDIEEGLEQKKVRVSESTF